MTEIIVLIKLVPDIRHIPEDAWDLKRGTLRRNRLHLIPNSFDDRALALALGIRDMWGGRVTALSMGPPAASSLCSRALAFGADRAVLVSDPVCAGSDTLATSTVLARAAGYLTETPSSMLILSGMQSPDGDTAQVPVQVAAKLGASVLPYITSATIDANRIELTSITSAGEETLVVDPNHFPTVITCTDQLPSIPFHTSLSRLGKAASATVQVLTAADLGLEPESVGLAGSATRVVTISVASAVRRESEFVEWTGHADAGTRATGLVTRIAETLSGGSVASPVAGAPADQSVAGVKTDSATAGGTSADGGSADSVKTDDATAGGTNPDGGETDADDGAVVHPVKSHPAGAVWALLAGYPEPDRLGILDHARQIADAMECPAVACLVVDDPDQVEADDSLLRALAAAGATDLLALSDTGISPVGLARALEHAVGEFHPQVMLLPASPEGRVTAPYLAARLGAGLTADCTSFAVKDYVTRSGGERRTYPNALYQKRPALGGNIEATIVAPSNIQNGLPQMATVRPGATVTRENQPPPRQHRWIAPDAGPESRSTNAVSDAARAADSAQTRPKDGHLEIERCKVLVSVGRGVGGGRGISELARPLAAALRERFNVDVEVSASRMVVDAGDLERDRQVGQTGKSVSPDIYIALGISGSAQHRAGMEGSAMIISVNTDPDAPIRVISDLFVHGRVEDVVPQLIAALNHPATV